MRWLLEVFLFTSFVAATQRSSVTSKPIYNVDLETVSTADLNRRELNCQSIALQNLVATVCENVVHVSKCSDTLR